MWELVPTAMYRRRFREFEKKHPAELQAMLANLEDLRILLDSGIKPALIRTAFLHREPMGVMAIDQKGTRGSKKQTRLYVYIVESDSLIYLITIGHKRTQSADIQFCKEFVGSLRRRDTT